MLSLKAAHGRESLFFPFPPPPLSLSSKSVSSLGNQAAESRAVAEQLESVSLKLMGNGCSKVGFPPLPPGLERASRLGTPRRRGVNRALASGAIVQLFSCISAPLAPKTYVFASVSAPLAFEIGGLQRRAFSGPSSRPGARCGVLRSSSPPTSP